MSNHPRYMPPRKPLAMAQQTFDHKPEARKLPHQGSGSLWRIATFGPSFLMTGLLTAAILRWFESGGLTAIEQAIVLLVGITFVWVSLSVSTVVLGLIKRIIHPCRITRTAPGPAQQVALLMPIYSEDTASVFGNASAMMDDLARVRSADDFTLFILSDTRDDEIAALEEKAFQELATLHRQVHYRRRVLNTDKKVGNLTDWIEGWGGAYDAMLVLDADSLMSGAAIRRLARELAADPDAGLIQSVPVLIGAQSLFGRMQQFSNAVYGWLLAEGLALWSQGEGNYWGHNAIIRTRAFAQSARLPYLHNLRGAQTLILSHDFVEAGLLRRAGWTVRFLPRVGGSFEEAPQTLIDYALRDRRWCQGNLQHLRLLGARGFHPISRFHLFQGAAAYLLSPLWFALIVIWAVLGLLGPQATGYFSLSNPLYPMWPNAAQTSGWVYLAVIYTMLLLPKIIGATVLGVRADVRTDYGGGFRYSRTTAVEIALAVLFAPIMMVQQTSAVARALFGRSAAWTPQQRGTAGYGLRACLRFHWLETALGAALVTGISLSALPLCMLPIGVPLIVAAPLSYISALPAQIWPSWLHLESPQGLRIPPIVTRAAAAREKMQIALNAPETFGIAAE